MKIQFYKNDLTFIPNEYVFPEQSSVLFWLKLGFHETIVPFPVSASTAHATDVYIRWSRYALRRTPLLSPFGTRGPIISVARFRYLSQLRHWVFCRYKLQLNETTLAKVLLSRNTL